MFTNLSESSKSSSSIVQHYLDENYDDHISMFLADSNQNLDQAMHSFQNSFSRLNPERIYPPPIFRREFIDSLTSDSFQLRKLVDSIPQRLFDGSFRRFLEFLKFSSTDANFLCSLLSARTVKLACHFCRPDFILTVEGPKAVEVNVAVALGGIGFCDGYLRNLVKSRYFNSVTEKGFRPQSSGHGRSWCKGLLDVCNVANTTCNPVIFEALADPDDKNPNQPDIQTMAQESGIDLLSGYIGDVKIGYNAVYYKGRRLSAVISMFTWAECRKFVPDELIVALTRLDEARMIDFISPPLDAPFGSKSNLELLTDPANASYFSLSELKLINRLIPETFRVRESTQARCIEERDTLVLKPSLGYGGSGIIFGNQVSFSSWVQEISKAVASSEPYVCQRETPDLWKYSPSLKPISVEYAVCLGPIIAGEHYVGTLIRQSPITGSTPIINAALNAQAGMAVVGS